MENSFEQSEIKLYSEFMLSVPVRILGAVFSFVGLVAFTQNVTVGCIFAPMGFIAWGLWVRGVFYPAERALLTETTLFFTRVAGGKKVVEINHISVTRIILKSSVQLAPVKGFAGPALASENLQYNVMMIFNKNQKETIHSVNDHAEALEYAMKFARELEVKIFYAASTPQKWIDPVTGKETIAELKKRR